MMRDKQMSHAVLYLNQRPCGKSSEDPQRCHANLVKILPMESELYVWEISETKSMTRHIYRGTGEAIKNDG